MKQTTRIKRLLRMPSYRIRLALFVVLGGLLIYISLAVPNESIWQNLGTSIATTFIGVGLISYLWDFLGGDPIEVKIAEGFDALESQLGSLKLTTKVLSDISEHNIGIERIWCARRDWDHDPQDGLRIWQKRICQAREVAIVSNTLWTRWFDDEKFRKGFFNNVTSGTKIRLLIYDPDSEILHVRAKDENDPQNRMGLQMQTEIISTLHKIAEGLNNLASRDRKNLEVRLSDESYHPAQIIRADHQILVSNYLSGKSGSPSPTFQVTEPSEYFSLYKEQVEILWSRGKPISINEMKKLTITRKVK